MTPAAAFTTACCCRHSAARTPSRPRQLHASKCMSVRRRRKSPGGGPRSSIQQPRSRTTLLLVGSPAAFKSPRSPRVQVAARVNRVQRLAFLDAVLCQSGNRAIVTTASNRLDRMGGQRSVQISPIVLRRRRQPYLNRAALRAASAPTARCCSPSYPSRWQNDLAVTARSGAPTRTFSSAGRSSTSHKVIYNGR